MKRLVEEIIHHSFILMLAGTLMVMAGCKEDGIITTGGVTGFVKMFDQYALPCDDMSGVKVNVGIYSTYTNNEGLYGIYDIPMGTYNLEFTKDGFTSDSCLIAVTPGDIPVFNPFRIVLAEFPDVTITSLEIAAYTSENKVVLKGTFSQSFVVVRFFIYFGNTADVSYDNYNYGVVNDLFGWNSESEVMGLENMVYDGAVFEKQYPVYDIHSYIPGDSAYAAVYIANPFCSYESFYKKAWPVMKVFLQQ